MATFTRKQFNDFFRLVQMSGSAHQMDRINSRLDMPAFIKATGRANCDAMYELISGGVTPTTLNPEIK